MQTAKTDQTGQMPKLIWVFTGRTYHFVGFVSMWLNYYIHMYVLSVNVLGLSDISGSKCMLRLKLWWFNVLWGAIKKVFDKLL